jgi:hypothetical protein
MLFLLAAICLLIFLGLAFYYFFAGVALGFLDENKMWRYTMPLCVVMSGFYLILSGLCAGIMSSTGLLECGNAYLLFCLKVGGGMIGVACLSAVLLYFSKRLHKKLLERL